MSSNVEPEEAEAIQGVAQEEAAGDAPAAVLQRDFRQPNRFSPSSLRGFNRAISLALPELDETLRRQFKCSLRTEIEEIAEVGAEGLFDDLEAPFALGTFQVANQPAWIRWDVRAAVQAIEYLLGSQGEPEARALSGIERHLLHDVFAAVVDRVSRALAVEAADLLVVQTAEDIPSWQDAGPDAEAHRLVVAVRLEGLGEGSTFHLYVPGIRSETGEAHDDEPPPLPQHLHEITVEVGAYLGSSDVPLDDLLNLELGDVIPLATELSDPLQLRVEGQACGTAEMGTRNGNRAVRVIEVTRRLEDIA